ncbi:DnaJ domain-containing protein [Pterulicium gracile]|uniref:Diphthamide biosynthesis protein 4 n=1 Tax=Pterulicium gracile TaxID=1884261 RepID=A0A5C3QE45_9AGAR|nr:DnaJ domain-containing protein [Pterula gracilis]
MSSSSSSVTPNIDPLDLYDVLESSPTASPAEIKQAYHRALLRYHPDKQQRHQPVKDVASNATLNTLTSGTSRDVYVLKHSYDILSDPSSREAYDASLLQRKKLKLGPRPAEVVSLHEFTEDDLEPGVQDVMAKWRHPCRCGGMYVITEKEMDEGQHLIGCWSCSEVIWVGYEAVDEEEEEQS